MRAPHRLAVLGLLAAPALTSSASADDAQPDCAKELSWKCFDRDGTAGLSPAEARVYALHRRSAFYREADLDFDGAVSADELAAYAKRKQEEAEKDVADDKASIAFLTSDLVLKSKAGTAKLDEWDARQKEKDAEKAEEEGPADFGGFHLRRALADYAANGGPEDARGALLKFSRDFRQIRKNRHLADKDESEPNAWSAEGVLLYEWLRGVKEDAEVSKDALPGHGPLDSFATFLRFERRTDPDPCEEKNVVSPGVAYEVALSEMPFVSTQFLRGAAQLQTDTAFDVKIPQATVEWEPIDADYGLGVPSREFKSYFKYTGRAYVKAALARVSSPGPLRDDPDAPHGTTSSFGPVLQLTLWPAGFGDKLKFDFEYEHSQAIRGRPRTSDRFSATAAYELSENTSLELTYEHGSTGILCSSKDELEISLGVKF